MKILSVLGCRFIDGVFGVFGMLGTSGVDLLLMVPALENIDLIVEEACDLRLPGLEPLLRKSVR